MVSDVLTGLLLAAAVFFFAVGTLGLLRFPDLYCRLHALTKADNIGLGLTVLALTLQAATWQEVFKLGLIWVMVLAASATVCFLIGNEAYQRGQQPWRRDRSVADRAAEGSSSREGETPARVGPRGEW
jgi:multicomponent Na+:H+ antiporter subunit G